MGRPKGGKNKTWTKEDKLRIVRRYYEEGIGQWILSREEQVARGLLASWIKKYQENGADGLTNQKKSGNPFAALNTSNSMTETERLQLLIAKQDLKKRIGEQPVPTILHTDQGAVYSSRAFTDAHKDYNIIRSMSRAGTPKDNAIIESINGWIKAELKTDFRYWEWADLEKGIEGYVTYFNNERPAYALDYKSPVQYKTEQGFG